MSVLTAVIMTQAVLYSLRNTRLMRSKTLVASKQRFSFRFNYTGASKWFFSMSGVILLIGALAIAGKGINFGIDFESGTRITAALQKSAGIEEVRKVLESDGYGDAKIQAVSNAELGQNVVQISTPTLEPAAGRQGQRLASPGVRRRAGSRGRVDRPDVRQEHRELGDHRDHRLAAA